MVGLHPLEAPVGMLDLRHEVHVAARAFRAPPIEAREAASVNWTCSPGERWAYHSPIGVPWEGGRLDSVLIWSLPCQRSRHGSCAGAVHIGIAKFRSEFACGCSCHAAQLRHIVTGVTPVIPA